MSLPAIDHPPEKKQSKSTSLVLESHTYISRSKSFLSQDPLAKNLLTAQPQSMCQYITHVRICFVCKHEDTVLISEQSCETAQKSGVFGSCGGGIANNQNGTPYQCWKCKEILDRASSRSGEALELNLI